MPLQKILFKPGVNRENTRYTTEGGWYECDKIRFRQGNPESIGGWQQISGYTYSGVCRSLWNWTALDGANYIGVGTNVKFYIEEGGYYYDITPIASTTTLSTDPFTTNGTTTVTITASTSGLTAGTYVTFSGATGTYATTFNAEYQIVTVGTTSFTITVPTALTAGSYGGSAVVAAYQVSAGPAIPVPLLGWGAGAWGQAGTTWGFGGASTSALRLWNQMNYGEDLVFGPRGGGLYYWDKSNGVSSRGVLLNSLGGTATFTNSAVTSVPTVVTSTIEYLDGTALQFAATSSLPTGISAATTYFVFNKGIDNTNPLTFNLLDSAGALVSTTSTGSGVYVSLLVDCPTVQNVLTVSDSYRFIITFGCNDYDSAVLDPLLIRWSNQNDPYNWSIDDTSQAGFARLSHGSEIITIVQARQEIVVFTDSSVYSLQYLGPPQAWVPQLLGDNISIMGPNAAVIASGIVYWMGVDKFYAYDGRVQTLNCDVRRYVFQDLNQEQALQVSCGTNEGFNEVWWFYCSANSNTVDKYVIYNYVEKVWYYGTMSRTFWLDSGLQPYPIAATYDTTTATGKLVYHENGINDNATGTPAAINAYISSSEFDIGDGHNFGFVWRILPDLTFENSSNSPTGATASTTMTLYGLANSGSGVTSSAGQPVAKSSAYVITEEFTGQIFTRMRGRQMIFKMESNQVNTAWQLGAPRIDIRPDGRR
jgi:hypothetical protein